MTKLSLTVALAFSLAAGTAPILSFQTVPALVGSVLVVDGGSPTAP
jgi:hypothetical protein